MALSLADKFRWNTAQHSVKMRAVACIMGFVGLVGIKLASPWLSPTNACREALVRDVCDCLSAGVLYFLYAVWIVAVRWGIQSCSSSFKCLD